MEEREVRMEERKEKWGDRDRGEGIKGGREPLPKMKLQSFIIC